MMLQLLRLSGKTFHLLKDLRDCLFYHCHLALLSLEFNRVYISKYAKTYQVLSSLKKNKKSFRRRHFYCLSGEGGTLSL